MFTERAVRLGKPRKSFLHFLPHREVGLSTLSWLQTASGLSLGYPRWMKRWFHTEEQMQFLDHWIRECISKHVCS